jgi:hypothetical protein
MRLCAPPRPTGSNRWDPSRRPTALALKRRPGSVLLGAPVWPVSPDSVMGIARTMCAEGGSEVGQVDGAAYVRPDSPCTQSDSAQTRPAPSGEPRHRWAASR